LEAVADGSFDLSVISNVLHELNPHDGAQLLTAAARLTRPSGGIVILELYPLLHPEAYAVPYEAADLLDLLRCAGFVGQSGDLAIKSGARAYWVWAESRLAEISVATAQKCIEDTWDRLAERSLGRSGSIILAPI
jgi:ubiquinone/menaquinone biosynthesis C-methylase UbiE